ncbi:vesicular acetylcholine transporter unc-17-like [Patiria miniata]|uniref:Major facilitator superfamily (MFS) profile domain-containing protein n=1 Tax=Patiria miniata TaxID=46514 RepID=A0A914BI80_PATMI|nr:vesicular acetylcholine transporter unc-17-like [Patiria miniata]
MADISGKTKWLRIATSIGALYLDSCLHGAVVPIVAEWDWAATDVPLTTNRSQTNGNEETRASFAIGAIFLSTGLAEIGLSPIAGMTADRFGFDVVILIGLLIGILKCLLFGLLGTSIVIVSTNRVLQGALSACTQTIAMARIRDVYAKASPECANVMAIALCKMAFNFFAGLVIGELYGYLKYRVFLLFLPISLLLIIGVLITFRNDNFHSKDESNGKDECEQNSSGAVRWRVICDVQLMIVTTCCMFSTLGQSSLEPSFAVWMKSSFEAGPESTGVILGLCGVASITSSLASAQILPALQHRSWIFCMASLCTAGVPLLLVNFSPNIVVAGVALCTHLFGATAARFTLLMMCSTIANSRYPQSYGLVFAMFNVGWAASFLLGPLLASYLFGSVCVICIIGAACIASSLLTVILQTLDSKQGPNIMDCFPNDYPKYQIVTSTGGPPLSYEEEIQQPKD